MAALKQADFLDYRITVEGHTSDAAPESGLYVSNWELSSARAAHVVRLLIEKGLKPENLKVVGYGSSMPKVPNRDGAGNAIVGNRARNERVVIKLERAS
jgi:chemotaxis protein MotB